MHDFDIQREIGFYLSHGLSQKEIGELVGISQQMVSYYRKALRKKFLRMHLDAKIQLEESE